MKKLMQLLCDNAVANRTGLIVQNSDTETTLYLYGLISPWDDITAKDVANALTALPPKSQVRMRLNSPGGDVFEARAIVTAMRDFQNAGGVIVAQVDALAASAASWIATAANTTEIADGAFMMVHNAMGICFGNASDMREYADTLQKIEGSILNELMQATGKSAEDVQAWLDAESWFDATECVANGLADAVISKLAERPANLAAPKKWNLAAFEKAPAKLLEAQPEKQPNFEAIRAHNERRLSLIQFA